MKEQVPTRQVAGKTNKRHLATKPKRDHAPKLQNYYNITNIILNITNVRRNLCSVFVLLPGCLLS